MRDRRLIAVTPYGGQAASTRVRVLEWIEWTGVRAEIHSHAGLPNYQPGTLRANAGPVARAEIRTRRMARQRPERLLLSREASPLSSGRLEASLLTRAELGVYDFDDALQWDFGSGLRRMAQKPVKCRRAVEAADIVIAGNEILADWASSLAKEVVVIPSCVDPSTYPIKREWSLSDPPRAVWLGSPSTEQHLGLVSDALLHLHRQTGLRVTVVSRGAGDLGPLNPIVDRLEWSESAAGAALQSADVALAPLIDSLYARGKCAYKLLQYAAVGLPIVASPVGTNASVISALGAWAAQESADWVGAISEVLSASGAARAAAGARARQAVAEHFSFEAWTGRWLSVLQLD